MSFRNFDKGKTTTLVFSFLFFFLTACSQLQSELDLSYSQDDKIFSAKGAYISKNEILTVYHFAENSPYEIIKKDETSDLALIKEEKKGKKILISSANLKLQDEIFNCEDVQKKGEVINFGQIFAGTQDKNRTETILNVAVANFSSQSGDSGQVFCNQSGEIIGILVATKGEESFLIEASKIREFLNHL